MVLTDSAPLFIFLLLGLVSKHDGGWRRIYYFFFLDRRSVNDNISKNYSAIKYITIDTIFQLVVDTGKKCLIIKRDIKDAFCNVLIAVQHQ